MLKPEKQNEAYKAAVLDDTNSLRIVHFIAEGNSEIQILLPTLLLALFPVFFPF